MEWASRETMQRVGVDNSDIQWVIPHQANLRIIEGLAKRLEMSMDKVYLTIHKYGNTSASSVPIALDELLREREVKEGDYFLTMAFGAGLTYGASVLEKIEE